MSSCWNAFRLTCVSLAAGALCWGAAAHAAEKQHDANTPAARNSKWPARHQAINDAVASGKVDLLFIGDSITDAWADDGRPTWDRFYAPRNAVNAGIGGDRTQHVLWRLQNGNLKGIEPKAAVIMIGTNNSGSNKPEETADGVTAIVDYLQKEKPNTKILLLAIFPRGENPDDPKRQVNEAVNKLLAPLGEREGVTFLDINSTFVDAQGRVPRELMPDRLHLNSYAYVLWANAMEPTLAKLLDEKPMQPIRLHAAMAPVSREEEKGWVERNNEINKEVAERKDIDVVFIGDSITQGWRTRAKRVWDHYYGARNAANLGISGDRTQHVLWRLENGNIDPIKPKLAIVLVGTNNVARSRPKETAEGVASIVHRLRTYKPDTKVLVLGIFPRAATPEDPNRWVNDLANQEIAKLVERDGVTYLNINKVFLEEDGTTLSREVMPDLLHLNEASYLKWAEAIEPTVAKLLGEEPKEPLKLEEPAAAGAP